MLPPPPEVYDSANELFQAAQSFANTQGYALIKKRTRKDNYDTSHSEGSFQSLTRFTAKLITLQNTNVISTKGHPLEASSHQQTNSTKKDFSGFELVEPKVKHCTICRQPEHNA
ncbi:14763_t:CDS:2, partial [Dentiscutata erythropus]